MPYRAASLNKVLSTVIFALEKQACADKSVVQSWIAWSNPQELWTTDKLAMACDFFVPASENFFKDSPRNSQALADMGMEYARSGPPKIQPEWPLPRWYSTVNMTLEIKRALPSEGVKWLFTRMKTKDVLDGRIDVHGEIWDESGNIIALTQQMWFVVDTSRAVVTQARKENERKSSKI